MGEVVELSVITTLPLDPDRVLQKAVGKLKRVLIIGKTTDGEEYFASSDSDGGTALWDMERAKHALMKMADSD